MTGPVATTARATAEPAPPTRPPATRPLPPRVVAGAPPVLGPIAAGPGAPLAPAVAARVASSLGVDVSGIRVHHGAAAAAAVGARAFAVGNRIVLGARERADDLALIAHEVAHTVQQRGARTLQRLTTRPGDRLEREAEHAAAAVVAGAPFTVQERTPPVVARLGLDTVLDYLGEKANAIPGFRMLTVVLGVHPVTMRRVERTPANVLRAVVELVPGGYLLTQALDAYGIVDKVADWFSGQVSGLGMTGALFRQGLDRFLDSLGWSDLLHPGDVWDRAKRIFTEPVTRLIDFGVGLVTGAVRFVKDAILLPLARLAQGTPGYTLLTAVLGRDPITGAEVPRTAETIIGPFMTMIGQAELWADLQKANAIPRAWAWFRGTLEGLLAFVREIPGTFVAALRALELVDLVVLPRAFGKLARVFAGLVVRFSSWAGGQVLGLLTIIFEVVAPAAMPYLRKAMGAFRTIIARPVAFVGNLVRAGATGFRQFSGRFVEHLRGALVGWLTGSLSGTGIYVPKGFDFREIVTFVLSVLGLTWQNVRAKLAAVIGAPAVKVLEETVGVVVTLVREGPAAAWEQIRDQLSNLRDMVVEQVIGFVKERIVVAAVTRLLASLNPAGAFVQAVIAIYNTVMFVVERLRQIAAVGAAVIDSIAAIAAGAVGAAANKVEQTMAGLLTLVVSFLARLVGLGKVSDAVVGVVNKIRAPVDKALDKVVAWIVAQAKRLAGAIRGPDKRTPEEKLRDLDAGVTAGAAAVDRFAGRAVGAVVLRPLLTAIRLRYRLNRLDPVVVEGAWFVEGEINPSKKQKTKAKATLPAYVSLGDVDAHGRTTGASAKPLSYADTQHPKRKDTDRPPGSFLIPSGKATGYVSGHLVPHRFGGPDDDIRNLAAMSRVTNNKFSSVETAVAAALEKDQTATLSYTVTCVYAPNGITELDAWLATALAGIVPPERLAGLGSHLFGLVGDRKMPSERDLAAYTKVDWRLFDGPSFMERVRVGIAWHYLPRGFSVAIATMSGSASVSGGPIDNHLPDRQWPERSGVHPLLLKLAEAERAKGGAG